MFKRGKLPARPDAVQLKFGTYFRAGNLPPPPLRIGHPNLIKNWQTLANDRYGDCVWAGAAHETMMICADAITAVPVFNDSNVLADYADATGFKPSDPSTDNGTDVQQAAAYRQKTGIVDASGKRHTIGIYTALRVGDLAEIAMATWLLGAVGIGVDLPSSADRQFSDGQLWDVVKGDVSTGGHYIPCVGRNSAGNFLFISWGRLQAATPAWIKTYMDEGIAYISLERLNAKGLSPEGFNEGGLIDDFKQVTA